MRILYAICAQIITSSKLTSIYNAVSNFCLWTSLFIYIPTGLGLLGQWPVYYIPAKYISVACLVLMLFVFFLIYCCRSSREWWEILHTKAHLIVSSRLWRMMYDWLPFNLYISLLESKTSSPVIDMLISLLLIIS